MRYIFTPLLISLLFACSPGKKDGPLAVANDKKFTLFSTYVNDSFYITISTPDTSEVKTPDTKYPVVYILDANLYFDVFAAIHKKYAEVGLLPQAILVGIGYKDFPAMDSLRQRDYTFPLALAEYEMPVSGKADAFHQFISNELIPQVEKRVRVDTTKRILAGHSLGGYFTMFSLMQSLQKQQCSFYGYIAASPSLHYNNGYLLKQIDGLTNTTGNSQKLFISFGSAENDELKAGIGQSIGQLYAHLDTTVIHHKSLSIRSANFSEMGHMDTQIPSFIQGLRWLIGE
jgi:predicted alpha/beta superfamily hydrolase